MKQIVVAELQPDETVDAVREARLLAKVKMYLSICFVCPSTSSLVHNYIVIVIRKESGQIIVK